MSFLIDALYPSAGNSELVRIMDLEWMLVAFVLGVAVGWLLQPRPLAVRSRIMEALDDAEVKIRATSGVHPDVLKIRVDELRVNVDNVLRKAEIA